MANRFYNYSNAFLPGMLARAETESAEFQAVQVGFALLDIQGVDSGVVNGYVVTTNSGQPSGSYSDGQIIEFKPLHANSGPATINVNGIGVSSIYDSNGANLVAGALGLGWTRLLYNSGFGGWELVAPTTSTVFTGVISGSSPTHKVGLNASGGVSTAAAPIDATWAIDQAIAPTWTAKHIFTSEVDFNGTVVFGGSGSTTFANGSTLLMAGAAGSTTAAIAGANGQWALVITNPFATSKGILVEAGTGASDFTQLWQNASGATLMSLYGDGGLTLGSPTGGDKGAGTINVAGNLYINGVAVSTNSSANPTASVGLAAVNGAASTYMRSDAAPPLDQSIAPTWTGAHIFTPGAGVGVTINAKAASYGMLISAQGASGSSLGLQVEAGTNTADFCFRLMNKAGTQDYLSSVGNGEVYVFEPAAATGVSGCHQVGYLDVPQNVQNSTYATVMSDRGKHIYHGSASAHTHTINDATVNYPVGSALTFINQVGGGVLTIALQTTAANLIWANGGSTGNRSLAAAGMATAVKIIAGSPGTWLISGMGLS